MIEVSYLYNLGQYSTWILSQNNKVRERKEIGKEQNWSLFADSMALHLEDPTVSINTFKTQFLLISGKQQDIKPIYKDQYLLYTNKEPREREIRKTNPFIIASKRSCYLGINLTTEARKGEGSYKTNTIRYWRKKLKKTLEVAKLFWVPDSEELVFL